MNKLAILGMFFLATSGAAVASTAINHEIAAPPAMIGVQLQALPEGLRSQLSDRLSDDRGVWVTDVRPGGPAEKAGIQPYDIIMSYADQELSSARQLATLVHNDQPGEKVTLQLLRGGKPMDVEVTLGEKVIPATISPYGQNHPHPHAMPRLPFPDNSLGGFGLNETDDSMVWDQFESIQVQTLANGQYRAEVKYRDADRNEKSYSFEGTREDIINQVQQQQDIDEQKKQQLLGALDMNPLNGMNHSMFNSHRFFEEFFDRNSDMTRLPNMEMPVWPYR